ncbi:hypothetical protein CEXT_258501 [Caerostris extrusa]|uniref:Uncharacterized protein n=1 Tax=Caerostris extrusa TaxID=172846 RepID=A0AAV4VEU5_CAEEX|nr:hypothetical protein CEXT_258501 [Caerostris extrusa]
MEADFIVILHILKTVSSLTKETFRTHRIQKAFEHLKLQNIRNFSGQQLKTILNKIQNTRSHKNPAQFNLKILFALFLHNFYKSFQSCQTLY